MAAPLQQVNPHILASEDTARHLCPIYGSVTLRDLPHPPLSYCLAIAQCGGGGWVGQSLGLL